MKTERKACAIAFLKAAIAYYKSLGIAVERVMIDNGSCYKPKARRNPLHFRPGILVCTGRTSSAWRLVNPPCRTPAEPKIASHCCRFFP